MYFGGLGSEIGYLQSINNAENAGTSFCLNPYGGNVGIGTTSPSQPLSVHGNLLVRTTNADGNKNRMQCIVGGSSDAANLYLYYGNSGDGTVSVRVNAQGDSYFNGGNVGIGETSPNGKLHIKDGLTCSIDIENTSNTGLGEITFNDPDADDRGALQYSHNNDAMIFKTAASERMRIDSSGNVLVGKTALDIGVVGTEFRANGQSLFTANGDNSIDLNRLTNEGGIAIFRQASNVVGSVSVTSSATAYNTSSDYRLKEDLQDFSGLDMVSKIPVYDFKWKADESRSYGVMAHELEEVLPQAVNGKKDAEEMQSVDYSKIVPLLVKSIQELKKEIEILKSK